MFDLRLKIDHDFVADPNQRREPAAEYFPGDVGAADAIDDAVDAAAQSDGGIQLGGWIVRQRRHREVDQRAPGGGVDHHLARRALNDVNVDLLGQLIEKPVAVVFQLDNRPALGLPQCDLVVQCVDVVKDRIDSGNDARDVLIGFHAHALQFGRRNVEMLGQAQGGVDHIQPRRGAFGAGAEALPGDAQLGDDV